MKMRCKKCEKIVDDEDIIIDGIDYNEFFIPWCKKCHKEEYPEEYK